MDEGFDFVWRAFKRPYFQQDGSKKVYMDVKDYVPYLKSWHENIASPARVRNTNPHAEEAPAGRLGPKPCETKLPRCAETMLKDKDFSRQSCFELLKSVTFASNRNQSSLSEDGGFPNKGERNITLRAFIHGGIKGVTKRTYQRQDLTKYLIAFMIHNGSHDKFTSISITQRDSLKVKSDPHNHRTGSCSLIALGDFKGGELWIQDDSPDAKQKVTDQDGTTLTGRLIPSSSKATVFDSNDRYKTMPWEGERWTVMAYSSSAYDQLEDSQINCLIQSGFLLQDQKKEFPPSPGVPTRDMTLFELATMDDPAPRPAEPRTKPKVKLKAAPKANLKLSPSLAHQARVQAKIKDRMLVALLKGWLMSLMVLRLNLHILLHLLAEVIHRMTQRGSKLSRKKLSLFITS